MKLFLMAGLMATVIPAFAQQIPFCGTDEQRRQAIAQHPEILEREQAFEAFAANRLLQIARIEGETLVIPVVFHVIHDYGPENISDAQIYDAIEKINQDFNATNPDFVNTIPEFEGIAANCQIEFRLAQKELSGGCTNGITRTASLRTYNGSDYAKLDGWQSGKYLNIWVTKSLPAGTAAYAYYPTSIVGIMHTVDGIICRYDYVGTIGTAGSYAAHVLSHEIGHYLNLQHVWGNSNAPGVACGDDMVPDTPMTEGWTSCNIAGNTCGGSVDNVQNHMEYSYCSTMFSNGQKNRMMAALESTDAMRNNLWTEENLMLTGTNDGYTSMPCAPRADFYASQRYICAGESITFNDVSYTGTVDTRSWTFSGGFPASSTESNPVVTYDTPGWYAVSLQVNNAEGSNTKEVIQYIHVAPAVAQRDRNYYDNFGDGDSTIKNWVLYNKYPDAFEWKWRNTNGYWNSPCIWLNSNQAPDLESDVIISPPYNLADGLANFLYFKYSTTSDGMGAEDYTMSLKLYYSTNCGDSWISMGKLTGDDLITSYGGSIDFYPQFPDQWRGAIFSLPENSKQDHVQFKMEFVANNYSNHIFIDDFNFTSPALDVPTVDMPVSITIVPNPVYQSASAQLHVQTSNSMQAKLSITDLAGRVIYQMDLGQKAPGSFVVDLSASDLQLPAGCYFIQLSDGQTAASTKWIVL